MPRRRLGILISGSGSTMNAVVAAQKKGELDLDIPVVISSDPDAGGIEKAQNHGITTITISPKIFIGDREAFDRALLARLCLHNVDVVAQLGWIPHTPPDTVAWFNSDGRIILNQHAGALRNKNLGFGGKRMVGLRTHYATCYFALHSKHPPFFSEATVHHVENGLDTGHVLARAQYPIPSALTPDNLLEKAKELQAGLLPVEHQLVIDTLKRITQGQIQDAPPVGPIVLPEEASLLEEAKAAALKAIPQI